MLFSMRLICGIDEAGRGAVVGPLVIAGISIAENDEEKLKKLKVKDSKLLTKNQRDELYNKILSVAHDYQIEIILPEEIDNAVAGQGNLNLNWLEAEHSALIIKKLSPYKVIIDCPSTNTSAYRNYLLKRISNSNLILVAEHKADINYPVVSSASIIAKVTRDREIDKLKSIVKIDFGSGYPSDPRTVDFLNKHFNKFPEIFRKTWMTVRNHNTKKNQKSLMDYTQK